MPYFEKLDILFIHIPKTGGSNIENFFLIYSNEQPHIHHLMSYNKNLKFNHHSLQHSTLREYIEHHSFFNISFSNHLKIITVVRNPYERIMSDLFFLRLASVHDTSIEIEKIIESYLSNSNTYDNHKIPQYQFLIDEKNKIYPKIKILKNESLNQEMESIGFPEFKFYCENVKPKSYMKYLSKKSIIMINNFYKKDFEYFNYSMII
jgi:hypothetical protein